MHQKRIASARQNSNPYFRSFPSRAVLENWVTRPRWLQINGIALLTFVVSITLIILLISVIITAAFARYWR